MLPATNGSAAEEAPTTAAPSETKSPTPAASAVAAAPAADTKRTLALGDDTFKMTLPCAPSPDRPDKDPSELGPMTSLVYTCDHEASGLSFVVVPIRFERALPASAKDSDRNAKSSAIAMRFAL